MDSNKVLIERADDWLKRLFGESAKELGGVLSDWIRHHRARRLLNLQIRYERFLKERGIDDPSSVPLKHAVPLLEAASLEDNETLFDAWARLLAAASDSAFQPEFRSAFIGILKGMDPLDVFLLEVMYAEIAHRPSFNVDRWVIKTRNLIKWVLEKSEIKCTESDIRISIDNLIRLRCVELRFEDQKILTEDSTHGIRREHIVSVSHGQDRIGLTALGLVFVRACVTIEKA